MSLPSNQLDAFVAVAKAQSFSGAAKNLGITQSALSQRILNLETELGSSLIIREPKALRLTDLGQRLLRYCQLKDSLEEEFMGLLAKAGALSGTVKLGAFSTVMRSVLIPTMSPFLKKNPDIQVEFLTREIRQLPKLLQTGEADYILLNHPLEKEGFVNVLIGYENNVLVEPKSCVFRQDVFLDHDSEDSTTADFFYLQKNPPKSWKRSYFDEIYLIIDGVLNGVGRAIIPSHLAKKTEGLVISKGYKAMRTPVYLVYYQQSFYTSLQKEVINQIVKFASKHLLVDSLDR